MPAALLVLAVMLQLPTIRLGRLDNNDWRKYASTFASSPVGYAAEPTPDDPGWRGRYFDGWLRYWQGKPFTQAPFSWWDSGSILLLWLPTAAVLRLWDPVVVDVLLLGFPLRVLLCGGFVALSWALCRQAPARGYGVVVALASVLLLAASTFDEANVTYFNSLYRESASLVFEVWLLALLVGLGAASQRWPYWFSLVGLLLVTSATIHSVVAPAVFAASLWSPLGRRVRTRVLLVLVLGAGLVFNVLAVNPETARNASFHALFMGVLETSTDPGSHLDRLGLPASTRGLLGHRAFEPSSRPTIEAFPQVFRHTSVVNVVLREPLSFVRILAKVVPALGARPNYLGHAEQGTARIPFRWFDGPRTYFLLRRDAGPILLLISTALMIWAALICWRGGNAWQLTLARATLFVGSIVWLELLGNTLGDGRSAVGRHLFLARIALDQSLILGAAMLIAGVVSTRSSTAAGDGETIGRWLSAPGADRGAESECGGAR